MSFSAEQLNELIAHRRAVFPNTYLDKPIPREIIEQILENANWAPTHKRTEPWRFVVLTGKALERLSDFLGQWYAANTPAEKFSEAQRKKIAEKPIQSACAIAICMKRDPKESLPEWEELAAVAAAVQNMWLTCTAYGIGCYWSTPEPALASGEFLSLGEGERCLGYFYMGYHQTPENAGKRGPIAEKVRWMGA